jgi:hypothetical protein
LSKIKDEVKLNSNLGLNLNIQFLAVCGQVPRTQQAKIALEQSKTQLNETNQD